MANEISKQEAAKQEVAAVRRDLERMSEQFANALPKHIPVERFMRVVMTALQGNPKLIFDCDRQSLFNACVKAAQDGLLPDGREGAIVPYAGKAQWLPMVFGVRKKVRNSGEIKDWDCHLVYMNDSFRFQLGDNPQIMHEPFIGGDRGPIIGAYAIAHLAEGGVSREWMSIEDIEAVRKQSSRAKSADSPWNVPAFYGEMCRKTVVRRHAKALPMSSDLDDLLRQDDNLYDLKAEQSPRPQRRATLVQALDQIANGGREEGEGDEREEEQQQQQQSTSNASAGSQQGGGESKPNTEPAATGASGTVGKADGGTGNAETASPATGGTGKGGGEKVDPAAKEQASQASGKNGKPQAPKTSKWPTTEREYITYAKTWIENSKDGLTIEIDPKGTEFEMTLKERWTGSQEKKIRNSANVSSEVREEIYEFLVQRVEDDAKKAHK